MKFIAVLIILLCTLGGAVASNYVVDEGDVLSIKVYENADLNTIARVNGQGSIALPLIGAVRVRNMTLQQIAQKITKRLADGYIVAPKVTVDISEFRVKKVTLLGQVNNPGLYKLHKKTTLLELISKAKGLTSNAGNQVIIKRNGVDGHKQQKMTINLKQLIEDGDTLQNIQIKDGDNIFIPTTEYYYITGEIKNPDKYKYSDGVTVFDAVTQAGGFTKDASLTRIKITRTTDDDKQELNNVDLNEILMANDVVEVPSTTVATIDEEEVTLLGKIQNPGIYVLDEETSFLEIISKAGGLKDDAGAKAVVKRKINGKEEILNISLKRLIEEGDTSQNIMIKEGDYIYIAPMETIFVTGEVQKPGEYKHTEGLTVIKAITYAGGFTGKAAPTKVKIIRKEGDQKKVLHKVAMDAPVLPNDVMVVPESFF